VGDIAVDTIFSPYRLRRIAVLHNAAERILIPCSMPKISSIDEFRKFLTLSVDDFCSLTVQNRLISCTTTPLEPLFLESFSIHVLQPIHMVLIHNNIKARQSHHLLFSNQRAR
jgi:hypothetical protein